MSFIKCDNDNVLSFKLPDTTFVKCSVNYMNSESVVATLDSCFSCDAYFNWNQRHLNHCTENDTL